MSSVDVATPTPPGRLDPETAAMYRPVKTVHDNDHIKNGKMPKGDRHKFKDTRDKYPAPGQYPQDRDLSATHGNSNLIAQRAYKWSGASRDAGQYSASKTPGPGQYDTLKAMALKEPRVKGGAWRKSKRRGLTTFISVAPGPGHYPIGSKPFHCPTAKWSKPTDKATNTSKSITPGPNHYKLENCYKSTIEQMGNIKFSKFVQGSAVGNASNAKSPGPGTYNILTDIGKSEPICRHPQWMQSHGHGKRSAFNGTG